MEDGEKKSALVKILVADALQFFNSLETFKKDVKMLFLWKLLVLFFFLNCNIIL